MTAGRTKPDVASLLRPLRVRNLAVANRIVMSPMTRQRSPGGVPTPQVADYYRRRAEGGTGLIITEGVAIDHPTAVESPDVPRLNGDAALAGWRATVEGVHAAGGKIVPQLWHVGPLWGAMAPVDESSVSMRPSGSWGRLGKTTYSREYVEWASRPGRAMDDRDIDNVISAYVDAARNATALGFDGIALHGGHGYLLDAFIWSSTNTRTDRWGGDLRKRTEFPAAVIRAIRAEIGDDLPIIYRFSQHKQQDYTARIAENPDELGVILSALRDAGVDIFDASGRYFDKPAFAGSPLTLAGWAKELTGAVSIAVGSVGMPTPPQKNDDPAPARLEGVFERLEREEFDLVAVGRMHLADPELATTLGSGRDLPTFDRATHEGTFH